MEENVALNVDNHRPDYKASLRKDHRWEYTTVSLYYFDNDREASVNNTRE